MLNVFQKNAVFLHQAQTRLATILEAGAEPAFKVVARHFCAWEERHRYALFINYLYRVFKKFVPFLIGKF